MAEVTAKTKTVVRKKRERNLSSEFVELSKAVNIARKGSKKLASFDKIRKEAVAAFSEAVTMAEKVGAYTSETASDLKSSMEKANSAELNQLAEEVIKHILYKKTVR